MFLDLCPENVIDARDIVKGNLIGRGAFGFVFKATMKTASSDEEPKSIAMKMLQPVQPGIRTRKVSENSLFSFKKKSTNCFFLSTECINGIQSCIGKMAT